MTAQEAYIAPPNTLLALTEAHRAVAEFLSLSLSKGRLLKHAPKGDGHPVMLLPGFLGGDGYGRSMRNFLAKLGYSVHGWGQGRNLGPRDGVLEALEERIVELSDHYGQSISLVGHSLGGIFAREIAREHPDLVRQVISLGSPFGEGRMTGSIPARLFTSLNPPEELPIDEDLLADAPPVPTTAIYSKGDGIVNWQTTFQKEGHAQSQNIQVRGSHCGMTMNPAIWYLVAQVLANTEKAWQPFAPEAWSKLAIPAVH
ncbi:MAG: lipase family alpha/beta hydrolase [Halioglobus sp.]